MDALRDFLREYHAIVTGTLGAIVTGFIMSKVYKASAGMPVLVDGENNEVFSHQGKMRSFLYGLGLVCLLFAALPAYALVYPREYFPKIALIIGFGFGGIYCLLEARRAFVAIRPHSLVVSGAFTGPREVAWDEIASVINYDTLQMLRVCTGNGRNLWISYMIGSFGKLVERLNQHGLPVSGQKPAISEMQQAVEEQTGQPAQLVWFVLPFVSIFKTGHGHAILLVRFGEQGFEGYHIHQSASAPREILRELIGQLRDFTASNDRELAQALSTDLQTLLDDPRAWPAVN